MESGKRQPLLVNIQALRAIAAILVVLIHMTLRNVGVEDIVADDRPWLGAFRYIGIFGVDLFFVISGFIMLVTNWSSFGKRMAGPTFLVRRAIRVYPPYWFATLPIFFVLQFARDRFMVAHAAGQTGILESFLLLPNRHQFILTVGWTLVWEMIFYIVFAAILPFERRFVPALLGLWFVVEIALNRVFDHSANFYLDFAHATLPIEFIFGAAIGLCYVKRKIPNTWIVATAAITATVVAFGIKIATQDESFQIDRVVFFGVPAALIVFAAVAAEFHGTFIAPKTISALGDGSYAVYLWHISILVVIRNVIVHFHPAGPIAHASIIVASLTIVITTGQLIYRFFERPVTSYLNARFSEQLSRKRASSKRTNPAAVELSLK